MSEGNDYLELTQSQYIEILSRLPHPNAYDFRRLGRDVLVLFAPEVFATIGELTETPHKPMLSEVDRVRFRLNTIEKFIPFWEPVKEIRIKKSQ